MRKLLFREWNGKEMCWRWDIPNGIEDENIMQYTGLKDKNGKEIYEGDIVLAASAGEKRRGEVAWVENRIFIRLNEAPHVWHFTSDGRGTDRLLEIIGNIYENPELIEK